MRVLVLLIMFVFSTQLVNAATCNDTLMQKEYETLDHIFLSYNSRLAAEYADSLLLVLDQNNLEGCKIALLISLKKGESLELGKEFESALKIYYNLLKKAEKLNHNDVAIDIHIAIGRLHEILQRPKDAKRNLKEAREMMSRYNDFSSLGHYAIRYASYHRIYEDIDTARYYAKLAVQIENDKYPKGLEVDANLLMGMLTPEFDESVSYYQKAVELYLKFGHFSGASTQTGNIAKKYFRNNRYEEGIEYVDLGLAYCNQMLYKEAGYNNNMSNLLKFKKEYFLQKGNIDSAFYYSELSHEFKSKARFQSDQDIINEIEIGYAIEKGKAKVAILENQKYYFQLILFLASLLLLVMTIFYFKNVRNQKFIDKQNRIISLKNRELESALSQKSTLLSEIHHRVKNNLQMVISLLILQSERSESPITKNDFHEISDKVRSIALIHDQLYKQGEFDAIHIETYFNDLFQHFQQLKLFDFEIDASNILLNLETLMPLGIITTELVSNTLKYALVNTTALVMKLTVEFDDDEYKLVYTDNGKGYDKESLKNSKPGMGSMLIYSMVRQLRGEASTYNNDGAIFELKFKEKLISDL